MALQFVKKKKFTILSVALLLIAGFTQGEEGTHSESAQQTTVFQDRLDNELLGPEMVIVPHGKKIVPNCIPEKICEETITDILGSMIKNSFAISKYEITFEEYEVFAVDTDRDFPEDNGWGRGRRPVIFVTWSDANSYVDWLSRKTGRKYRLPSVIEWEHAARAGEIDAYWWGSEIGLNRANCSECGSRWSNSKTSPVGSFAPNPWGIYDIHGNVSEFTQDCAMKKRRIRLKRRIDLYKLTDEPQYYRECEWIHIKGYSWITTNPSSYRQKSAKNNPQFPRKFTYGSHLTRSSATGIRVLREL